MIRTRISTRSFIVVTCLTFVLYSVLFTEQAVAHSDGSSIEETTDGYIIDIGYSPEAPRAEEQTRFDFHLYDAETDEQVLFTDIWFRLEDEGRLLFAGGLAKAEFGATGMTISFPTAGTYTGFARFSNEEGVIVETEFTLTVEEGNVAEEDISPFIAFASGMALGALVVGAVLFGRRRRRSTDEVVDTEQTTPTSRKNLILSVTIGFVCAVAAFYVTVMLFTNNEPSTAMGESHSSVSADGMVSVVLTDEGFEPSEFTITRGTTVEFSTITGKSFWPASNLHPTHEIYPAFDPLEPIPSTETWRFTFDEVGSWSMHDHLRSYLTGTIHVVEE